MTMYRNVLRENDDPGNECGILTRLAVKSVLDFIIIAVMTSSLGKGCAFSAIPAVLLAVIAAYIP